MRSPQGAIAGAEPVTGAQSRSLFERAQRVIPGGVNSPVRAFGAVGGNPPFVARGRGSRLWDVDGKEYLDYVGSWGPLILGHAHPAIVEAVRDAAASGTSFGAPTAREVELAELVTSIMPSMEKVRLVSSGTEAAMSAVRLARAATGRRKLIKFEGCYHGHGDSFLIQAGSGAATFGQPSSPGVTAGTAADTLNARYNDAGSVAALFAAHQGEVAAVIVEPVAANMGTIAPAPGFLAELRRLSSREGALLIFDEVITGFRLGLGGAQALFGVVPDLTILGKVLGGGLPIGAYGGRADLMDRMAPSGPVYQAGTLSGNPIATAAGLAQLKELKADPAIYRRLDERGARLAAGLGELAMSGTPITINRVGSLVCLYFASGPVTDWESAAPADTRRFAAYFHAMLDQGIYLPPSQFEALFVSAAHTEEDIARTIEAARAAMSAVAALPATRE
jgi:glutamate-1-semialdehyde 2,1-aminomutase